MGHVSECGLAGVVVEPLYLFLFSVNMMALASAARAIMYRLDIEGIVLQGKKHSHFIK